MSDNSSVDGLAESIRENRPEFTAVAVAVGLLTFSLGYETGSVLAGDPLEVLWLVPVVLGTSSVVLALLGRNDER